MSKLNVSECPHLSHLKAVLDCGKNQGNHSAQTCSPHGKEKRRSVQFDFKAAQSVTEQRGKLQGKLRVKAVVVWY